MTIVQSNRLSAKKYHVPANTVEFTDEHLKLHKKFFNKEIYPEYFTDFEHKGLTYFDTILIDRIDLEPALDDKAEFGVQLYRFAKNKKFNAISESVRNEGVDLRKKPLQVVVTLNEHKEITKIHGLFNGNTLNLVLDKHILENRICAIFITNSNFSPANLIEIGANQNALDKPFGAIDFVSLEYALTNVVGKGEGYKMPVGREPTQDEISEFSNKLKDAIKFMGQGRFDVDSVKCKTMINKLLDDQLEEKVVLSVTHGSQVMEYLRKYEGYVNTPTVKYNSLSCIVGKILTHFELTYREEKDFFDNGGRYEIIIHAGVPDMSDPVNVLFREVTAFWRDWNRLIKFTSPHGFLNNADMRIIGLYQPLKCLDHLFNGSGGSFGKVVRFEKFVEHFNKYPNNLVASELEKVGTVALTDKQFIEEIELEIDSLEEYEEIV